MITAAVVALCVGCSTVEVTGQATPAGELDPGTVAGLPVTQGPSGLKPGVSSANLKVQNTDNGDMDHLTEDALSDIFTYWAQQLPVDFGKQFKPVTKLISFDSNGTDLKVCGGQDTNGVENAFFCPVDDSVAWDRGTLLPVLNQMFGPMAVVTVFAHEMGHAVQYQLGSITDKTPTIVKEQQADCYAGAFMRWVAQGDAQHFQLSTGNGLSQVLATMMFIRDQVGTTSTDEAAHGSAFDRVTAFQFGFGDGPVRCNKIDNAEIQQRITELGFTSESLANNNVPVDAQTLQLLTQSLGATFNSIGTSKSGTSQPKIVTGDGTCTAGKSTPPASYCPTGNTVEINQDKLNVLATLPQGNQLGVSSGSLGDFAAFGEIASRYVLAVQKAQKIPLTDPDAGLRTACMTGAWAGVARHRFANGPQQQLLLGPGDLDEAVAELLSPNSLIAADVNGRQVPSGFARVQAFQIGFLQGSKNCLTEFNWN
ncbi:MAG TPA: neutral zinc metallopeptidase [Pseudonocardiaceae bacterium]